MKAYFRLLAFTSVLSLSLIACSHQSISHDTEQSTLATAGSAPAAATSDTSQNSLDWPGIYTGILPCADCEGISTSLTLNKDLSYSLAQKYLGKSDVAHTLQGSFRWNTAGNIITLGNVKTGERANQFLVGENRLIQLDLQGNKIDGALADNYILTKTPARP